MIKMGDAKQFKLVNRLVELTKDGEVNWTTAGDDETFVASVGQYGVVITKDSRWSDSSAGTDSQAITLRLLDPEGEPIDEIRARDLSDDSEHYFAEELLQELFNCARRRAKGADKAIDGILAELDKREKVK